MKQNEQKTAKIMPESFYSLDSEMSLKKLDRSRESKELLVGKVLWWDSNSESFNVDLGNGFLGVLPLALASIYPPKSEDGLLTAPLRSIIGKNILVTIYRIIDFTDGTHCIVLSRKDNMQYAFDHFSNCIGQTVECCITSLSSIGAFVDIGYGVTGLIDHSVLSVSRSISCLEYIGLTRGTKLIAKIISIEDNHHIQLNFKDQFENLAFKLKPGDLIEATILRDVCGYFAYVNPNTPTSIDLPLHSQQCKIGSKVIARVINSRPTYPELLRLTFVSLS